MPLVAAVYRVVLCVVKGKLLVKSQMSCIIKLNAVSAKHMWKLGYISLGAK